MQEIRNYGIKIYQFPDAEEDEDETQANRKLKVKPCIILHRIRLLSGEDPICCCW